MLLRFNNMTVIQHACLEERKFTSIDYRIFYNFAI
jgi:hypothetical protein